MWGSGVRATTQVRVWVGVMCACHCTGAWVGVGARYACSGVWETGVRADAEVCCVCVCACVCVIQVCVPLHKCVCVCRRARCVCVTAQAYVRRGGRVQVSVSQMFVCQCIPGYGKA